MEIGDGRPVRFLMTFGMEMPLATQFWDLYFLIQEKNKTFAELWDGVDLKCTFRRNFSHGLMS